MADSAGHILIVEDEPAIAEVLAEVLADEGYRATVRAGGAALATAREDPPDLVLLEWGLAGGDGGDTCRTLRDDPATAGARIIIIASWTEGLDAETARAAGADDYIEKPFSPLQLHVKVRRLLGKGRASG